MLRRKNSKCKGGSDVIVFQGQKKILEYLECSERRIVEEEDVKIQVEVSSYRVFRVIIRNLNIFLGGLKSYWWVLSRRIK